MLKISAHAMQTRMAELGLTPTTLAEKMQLSKQSVYNQLHSAQHGKPAQVGTVIRFATALGMSPEALCDCGAAGAATIPTNGGTPPIDASQSTPLPAA